MNSTRKVLPMMILLASVQCSTVGVVTEDRAWAVVQPSIANQMILDTPSITIFDLRGTNEYLGEFGHLDGAVSMPFDTLTERISEIQAYRDQTILVYGDVQSDVLDGVKELAEAGCRNLVLIDGGIRHWIELGYKTVRSP